MSAFCEFSRISKAHRSSKSVGRYMRHGNSVSDFLLCNLSWTNQSSLTIPLSLFRHPNHPPKMHYRISQWLPSFDAWMLETRRAIVVHEGAKATRGGEHRKVRNARDRYFNTVLSYTTSLFYLLSLFFPPSIALRTSLIFPTNYSQRSISITRINWNKN